MCGRDVVDRPLAELTTCVSSGWTDGGAEAVERNAYLMMTLALVLLGLGLASWPLLYLLLQSYVPSWPGVMCIDGVTRIGTGSLGASRFLPGLLTALQVFKPLLMLMGGAWLVTVSYTHLTLPTKA